MSNDTYIMLVATPASRLIQLDDDDPSEEECLGWNTTSESQWK